MNLYYYCYEQYVLTDLTINSINVFMNISFFQIIILIFVIFLLFGDFNKIQKIYKQIKDILKQKK